MLLSGRDPTLATSPYASSSVGQIGSQSCAEEGRDRPYRRTRRPPHRDLLTVGERQAPALQVAAPPRTDSTVGDHLRRALLAIGPHRHRGVSDELATLQCRPEHLHVLADRVIPKLDHQHPHSAQVLQSPQEPAKRQPVCQCSTYLSMVVLSLESCRDAAEIDQPHVANLDEAARPKWQEWMSVATAVEPRSSERPAARRDHREVGWPGSHPCRSSSRTSRRWSPLPPYSCASPRESPPTALGGRRPSCRTSRGCFPWSGTATGGPYVLNTGSPSRR
jgi:hypothetical protein